MLPLGILTIFRGFLGNKWIMIAGAVVLVFGLIVFGLWKYKQEIKDVVYHEIYAEQVEELLERQEKEVEKLKSMLIIKERSIEQLNKKNLELGKQITSILNNTVNNPTLEDGDVSPVLRETINQLKTKFEQKEITKNSMLEKEQNKKTNVVPTGNSAIDEWKRLAK